MHVIAGAWRTVSVDEEFRHDEQADTLNPLRCALGAGEDQVDDVLRQLVVAEDPPALALVKMVEDKSVRVPYAYMRSVILTIRAYPAPKASVAAALVPKLVEREVCLF